MAYWLAWQYTQHVVDRSLADLATAISRQIQLAGVDAPVTVPPLAQAMFSDPVEQLIYRISDGENEIWLHIEREGTWQLLKIRLPLFRLRCPELQRSDLQD